MPKTTVTADELKRLIAAELEQSSEESVEPDALIIVEKPSAWHASLRNNGLRIDEARLAALSEITLRLSAGYALAGPPCLQDGAIDQWPTAAAVSNSSA